MKKLVPILTVIALGLSAGCTTTGIDENIPEVFDNDPMIVQLSSMARQAFAQGEMPRAIVLYRRALDRARAMDNSAEIGNNAYNLAACLAGLEEWEEASKLLGEAEREKVRAGDDPGPAILLLADIQRKNGQWKEALNTINRLEKVESNATVRGQAYVMRAHIACDRDNASEAEAFLERARGFLRKNRDSGLAGEISHVSGRIATLNRDWYKAALAYDREAAWRKRSGRLFEMAEALERAGQNYVKAEHTDKASDRLFRAARSLMAQGYYLNALHVIEAAVELQDGGTDDENAAAVAELFEEIRESVENMSQAASEQP